MKKRICYFGTYREYYSRNKINIARLRDLGYEVIECHVPLFGKQHLQKSGKVALLIYALMAGIPAYCQLMVKTLRVPKVDLIIVGYIGQLDVFFAWLFKLKSRTPLLFDPLISLYDTVVLDRKLTGKRSVSGKIIRLFDNMSFLLADRIWTDTEIHREYFSREFSFCKDKLDVVYIGCDETTYAFQQYQSKTETIEVLHYSYFSPLQGVAFIVDAAHLLRNDEGISFRIIGTGQEARTIKEHLRRLQLDRVSLEPVLNENELAEKITRSSICLGMFGKSEKRDRVIPNKIYQYLSVGRPVITGHSQCLEQFFTHDKHMYFCPPASAEELAASIRYLADRPDMRQQMATEGHARYMECFSNRILSDKMQRCVEKALHGK